MWLMMRHWAARAARRVTYSGRTIMAASNSSEPAGALGRWAE
jgi:hypothetical protein